MMDGEGIAIVATRGDWIMTDRELLTRHLKEEAGGAFDELVRRHTPMVYASCMRVLGDAHAAEDSTQATFLVLMKKAGRLSSGSESLAGWLHRAARFAALDAWKAKKSRERYEQEATAMQEKAVPDADWADIRLVLDEALDTLPRAQREAVILRYLQGQSEDETANLLGLKKGTLKARLSRAMETLRKRLGKRGVAVPVAALAMLLTENASAACPPTLITSVQATCAGSATASATATLITKGVVKAMFWMKMKMVATVVVAVTVVTTSIPVTMSIINGAESREEETPSIESGKSAATASTTEATAAGEGAEEFEIPSAAFIEIDTDLFVALKAEERTCFVGCVPTVIIIFRNETEKSIRFYHGQQIGRGGACCGASRLRPANGRRTHTFFASRFNNQCV